MYLLVVTISLISNPEFVARIPVMDNPDNRLFVTEALCEAYFYDAVEPAFEGKDYEIQRWGCELKSDPQ